MRNDRILSALFLTSIDLTYYAAYASHPTFCSLPVYNWFNITELRIKTDGMVLARSPCIVEHVTTVLQKCAMSLRTLELSFAPDTPNNHLAPAALSSPGAPIDMPHLDAFIVEEHRWDRYYYEPLVNTCPYLHAFFSRLGFTSLSSLELSTFCNVKYGTSSIVSFFTTHLDSLDTLTTLSLQYSHLDKDEFVSMMYKLGPCLPLLMNLKLYASPLTFPERDSDNPPHARFRPSVLERFHVQGRPEPWFPSLERFTCVLGTSWEEFDDRDLLEFLVVRLSNPSEFASVGSPSTGYRRLRMADAKMVSLQNIHVLEELKRRGADVDGFELVIQYGQDSLWKATWAPRILIFGQH